MRRMIAATAMLSAATCLGGAQTTEVGQPRTSPAAIAGRVVADETGEPLANARVSIKAAAGEGTPVVLSDPDGHFAFNGPAGHYAVVASKSRYARRELTATPGQACEIRLRRAAVITGRAVDEFGEPVIGANVVAETTASAGATGASVASSDTDDRGDYRLTGLDAGTFVVAVRRITAATMNPQGPRTAEKTYYPGVGTSAAAQPLRLRSGEEQSGVDFVVPADGPIPLQMMSVMRAFQVIERRRAANPALFPAATPLPTVAQNSDVGTGIIRGRVTSSDGQPITHAHVMVVSLLDVGQWRGVYADPDGSFEFRDLAAGRFDVMASKPGYSQGSPSPSVTGGFLASTAEFEIVLRPVTLRAGETIDRLDLPLARNGTLEGRVLDELGDPLEGANVQVMQMGYVGGRQRLVPAGIAARLTDDLGRYRLYGLKPGQYIISATIGGVYSADLPGYTRSYFPGTPNAGQAQFVSIGVSQDVSGIDFSMSRTETARVAGRVLSAAGEPTTGGGLTLMPSQQSISATSVAVGARILADGKFEFPNVPPGQYVIRADRGRSNPSTEGEFATVPVSVNGSDITDLVVHMSAGSSIRGRFVLDTYNNSKPPSHSAFELSPVPIDLDLAPMTPASAAIYPDWRFEMAGVNGPRRLQLLRVPPGWALKEIRVNGFDVTDRPLPFGRRDQSLTDVEVVVTDRINKLNGTIADDRGAPVAGAAVIVFSTDRDRWYPTSRFLRIVTGIARGAFTVAGLPPGSYYAAAVVRLPTPGEGSWEDPEFLTSLISRATSLTLGDGQEISLSLRAVR